MTENSDSGESDSEDGCPTCKELLHNIELATRFNDPTWAYKLNHRLQAHRQLAHSQVAR